MCCHRSPTATCDGSNPVVGSLVGQWSPLRKEPDQAVRLTRAAASTRAGWGARGG